MNKLSIKIYSFSLLILSALIFSDLKDTLYLLIGVNDIPFLNPYLFFTIIPCFLVLIFSSLYFSDVFFKPHETYKYVRNILILFVLFSSVVIYFTNQITHDPLVLSLLLIVDLFLFSYSYIKRKDLIEKPKKEELISYLTLGD